MGTRSRSGYGILYAMSFVFAVSPNYVTLCRRRAAFQWLGGGKQHPTSRVNFCFRISSSRLAFKTQKSLSMLLTSSPLSKHMHMHSTRTLDPYCRPHASTHLVSSTAFQVSLEPQTTPALPHHTFP